MNTLKQAPRAALTFGVAVKDVLAALAKLEVPTYATLTAGVLAPVIAGLFGLNIDPKVLGGYLALLGLAAAGVQNVTSKPATPPAAAPPAAPKK